MSNAVDVAAKAALPFIESRIYQLPKPDDPFASPPKEGKVMVFIGGGNGSGKTGITNKLFDSLSRGGYQKRHIATFGSSIFEDILSSPVISGARHSIAEFMHSAASSVNHDAENEPLLKQIVFKSFCLARDKVLDQNLPIVIDYHMHDSEFVKDCVRAAKNHGYETVMISPHVDMDGVMNRLEKRRELTGKPYNVSKITSRHQQFAQHLEEYIDLFDLTLLLNNNHAFNQINGLPPLIAVAHRGNTEIFDPDSFQHMFDKSTLQPNGTSTTQDPITPQNEVPSNHARFLASERFRRQSSANMLPASEDTEPFCALIKAAFCPQTARTSPSR